MSRPSQSAERIAAAAAVASPPRVTIGVPVYNGEPFLEQALDSILSQTFTDFEIVISDNASTDRTEEIGRAYAARDPRIRYYRSDVNRGAAWNHNRVFELARGEYFKWNAADDFCAPRLLERCVAALERDPDAVMACTDVVEVDAEGKQVGRRNIPAVVATREPLARFKGNIELEHWCQHVYGVIRSSVLRRTDLIGGYSGSDRVLLSHLSLFGHFLVIPEALFMNREHPQRSVRAYPLNSREAWLWFNPAAKRRWMFPYWRQLRGFWGVIARSPLGWRDRLRCYGAMLGWIFSYKRLLLLDLQTYRKWMSMQSRREGEAQPN
jgi:glycosyltransferase involved in cell wall biosynthesis